MTDDRRLIEVNLPPVEVSAQSAREKSIRHGHISTLHIWRSRQGECYALEPQRVAEGGWRLGSWGRPSGSTLWSTNPQGSPAPASHSRKRSGVMQNPASKLEPEEIQVTSYRVEHGAWRAVAERRDVSYGMFRRGGVQPELTLNHAGGYDA